MPDGMIRARDFSEDDRIELEKELKSARRNAKRKALPPISRNQWGNLFGFAVSMELQLNLWGLKPKDRLYKECMTVFKRDYKNYRDSGISDENKKVASKILEIHIRSLSKKYDLGVADDKAMESYPENYDKIAGDIIAELEKIYDDGDDKTILGRVKNDFKEKGLVDDTTAKQAIKKAVYKVNVKDIILDAINIVGMMLACCVFAAV